MGAENAEELKKKGNGHFQKGEWKEAADAYTAALSAIDSTSTTNLLRATLLSNRAACCLKQKPHSTDETNASLLESCIEDCTQAFDYLQKAPSPGDDRDQQQQRQKLLGKLLYRRASGRALLVASLPENEEHLQSRQKHLRNEAARDLLKLLSFDPNNADASRLLKQIRLDHDATSTSGVNSVLSLLRETPALATETLSTTLFQLLSLVTDDPSSASMELGRALGVTTLMQILTMTGKWSEPHSTSFTKCRLVASQVLSAASSHGTFVRAFLSPNQFSQQSLAKLVLEAPEPDLAVATMGLMMRIVLFLDHNDNAEPILDSTNNNNNVHLVDDASLCRMCVGALRTLPPETRPARAAMELLSAWTASDMDSVAFAAAATADAYRDKDDSSTFDARVRRTVKSEEEVRRLKPRELAMHRKREYELQQAQKNTARARIQLFCDVQTGGLSALLECAVTTLDRTLRRQVASAVARWLSSAFDFYGDDSQQKEGDPQKEGNAKVKKLFGPCLGWNGATNSANRETTLTIEELDDEDEDEDEEKGTEKDGEDKKLLETLKRAHLTAAMLMGNAEAGAWALATGWSNGSGVSELRSLIALRHNDTALSLASDVISAASASEKARSSLVPLVEGGDLSLLLASSDRSVRSAAASAMTKLGLANKEISTDEGEMVGLLQVAAELVMHDGDDDDNQQNHQDKKRTETDTTTAFSESFDRGIEVLSYLASRTPVKEEIAHGFKPSPSSPSTVLERLVDLSCRPGSGEKVSAFGLASIFELTAVSLQTLRNEALADKGISAEDYDQLQSLGKTEEEKEAEKTNRDSDPPEAVAARVVALSQARVPRALFKLCEGSTHSEATQEKIAGAMNRMAVEAAVRGAMIQQGCLSACLKLEKKGDRSKEEKAITLKARHCLGKLLATTNPNVLTASQRLGSIRPLLQLVRDHDSTDFAKFEALLALTNLATVGDDSKDRIMAENGLSILHFAMFSDHEMVRRAATEALSNLVPHPDMMKHLADPNELRMWVAFAMDFDKHFQCARAAAGCLAMALFDRHVAQTLVELPTFRDFVVGLLECGNLELMHRVLVVLLTLLDHVNDEDGNNASSTNTKVSVFLDEVVATSGPQFCLAYAQSYHDGKKAQDLEMTPADRETMKTTVELAKEVARRCY